MNWILVVVLSVAFLVVMNIVVMWILFVGSKLNRCGKEIIDKFVREGNHSDKVIDDMIDWHKKHEENP